MSAASITNRKMFWRILRRLLTTNPARLAVILLGLGAGAAITAALLNLQVDAKRRLTTEFRAFGTNVLITAKNSPSPGTGPSAMDSSLYERIPKKNGVDLVAKAALLYGVVTAAPWDASTSKAESSHATSVVAVGYEFFGNDFADVFPSTTNGDRPRKYYVMGVEDISLSRLSLCKLGEQAAARLGVRAMQFVELQANGASVICAVDEIRHFGGPEDSQVFLQLSSAQELFNQNDRISVIALNVPGNPDSINRYIANLAATLSEGDVRPIRQFTEGEAKIYNRISGLLTFTVALVLVLTALCVMAAMTNVAMERRNDVGLMKALGGATRRIVRLFFVEAALLGLAAGLLGAAAGIVLSIGLGKAVFGLAARPRLIVYPISVALTILVALTSSYPLRRLGAVRPSSIFRGEA